jgi:tripartite-type tricarboxylate transporter receptor subunit TctC
MNECDALQAGALVRTRKSRRSFIKASALLAAGAVVRPGSVLAQSYPDRPIRLVVPWPPGGSADILGRLFAAKLGRELGASIVVFNQPGAGGTIGSERVAKAAPDGYTLLQSNVSSQGTALGLYKSLSYDPLRDFQHIGLMGTLPNVLIVRADLEPQTFGEFLEYVRARPDSATFGSAGNGSSPHLSAELLKMKTGINALHIPFKGSAPCVQALLEGSITFEFENTTTAGALVQSGRVRALGMTGSQRIASLPDVPTMKQLGVDDLVVESWFGLSAPAKSPEPIIDLYSKALLKVSEDPDIRKTLVNMGVNASVMSPVEFREFVENEVTRWTALIEKLGINIG